MIKGVILWGMNNIFNVLVDGKRIECRIKGKVLKDRTKAYNPLASGDIVTIELDPINENFGLILSREDRKNHFSRWNKKRNAPQIIAANVDQVICVCSPESPPFRPRFIDRAIISAENGGIKPIVVLNKIDQNISKEVENRLEGYRELGYEILRVSAKNGENIEKLRSILKSKTTAFVGQSGVGKSTLLNSLNPELMLRVGEVSEKFNRGKHTTCYAVMVPLEDYTIIDTPGIRELNLFGVDPSVLSHFFPEFDMYWGDCKFKGCTHTHEPGCAIKKAIEDGNINEDRFKGYNSIISELEDSLVKFY
ncbi:ribosome small subunit-dependent GTPase A [Thiospirochaeta perfilievii]|uniref:Small ribosomal subunit biogenesis GTPase RsgA n=1 Tax=Thiospirochaeta perfilievii TaxID=252967 RepID=A0A5C1QDY1_9SPIO|nr:ribosome small subunit-dependent GTPase A [Thiospirochaeta perfilievii]QEN05791.1 ribosome small subunit-dependent GTPase A [Thiospirochaeta perfilievii]